jgi:hypothetical protein
MLHKNLKSKILARLDELIEHGVKFQSTIKVIPALTGNGLIYGKDRYAYDQQEFAEWRTNCLSIITPLENSSARHQVEFFRKLHGTKPHVEYGIGILRGLRGDLVGGFLDDLELKMETEISGDYLGQAEQLLNEGRQGHNEHVPAAVLSGAVLEKSLRCLCARQKPPIAIINDKGFLKTMNPLIDDLKSAGLYNEVKAKQLRAWADIRNKAAHGHFDQFTKQDVELMLKGVSSFLAEYTENP